MKNNNIDSDEHQRRILQEYIFNLEETREQAEELAIAHEKIKQSESFLTALLSSTTHGIFLVRNRTLIWCNKAMTDILGWDPEALIGRTTPDMFPNFEENISTITLFQDNDGENIYKGYEHEFLHKEGHRVPCLVSWHPQDKEDLSKGHVFSVTDFSELKTAQIELKKANEVLESLTQELLGKNEQLSSEIKERKETERRLNGYRDHLEELVKERTLELKQANKQLQLEILERKQQEDTLKQLEELESSALGAISHVVLGLKDRIIIFANDAVERVFGWKPDELIGKNTRVLYESDEKFEAYGDIYAILAKQKFYSREMFCRRKDGNEIICKFNASRIGESLQSNQIVVTYEDITERKKLESQLLQAQKMEAIGTLAGGIAHDTNNIQMGIQGYTSLALLNLDPSHPHYGMLTKIEQQVESGVHLTKQILGFARGGKYEVKTTDINDIIERTSSLFGRTKKEITIHIKYGEGLHAVDVDRGQIEQVLLNLYVNAWQAMPFGGKLHIETQNMVSDRDELAQYALSPGNYIKISIMDTGIGMDKKTKERIFEPFFTTKEMGRGTGLGLASAYGIIKNHGGSIHVISAEGHGSTFNIYLPASPKVAAKEKPLSNETLRGGETILLVDDETVVAEVSKEILEYLGYKVIVAGGGREALRIFDASHEKIALVILDMIMPDMGGAETFERLKAMSPDVKVILSTGYSINGRAGKIMNQGCNAFIQKPFRIEDLSQKIREVLDA